MSAWDFKNNLLLPLVVATISGAIGWFLSINFGPKNIDKEMLKTQQTQVEVLSRGFADIITLLKEKQLDTSLIKQINNYSIHISELAKTTNEINSEYNLQAKPVDTIPLIIPAKVYDREIRVKTSDRNSTIIDEVNTIAIREKNDAGNLLVTLNHSYTSMGPGDMRTLRDLNKKKFEFYYKGEFGEDYVFIVRKWN